MVKQKKIVWYAKNLPNLTVTLNYIHLKQFKVLGYF